MIKNDMLATVGWIIVIIACACAGFGTVGSVIYFIYEWAVGDSSFKVSLWEAAKLWLMLVPGGLIVAVSGYFILEAK